MKTRKEGKQNGLAGAGTGNTGVLLQSMPIKSRTQTYNSHSRKWIKRDGKTGKFCGVKKDGGPWRRVAVEENTQAAGLGW